MDNEVLLSSFTNTDASNGGLKMHDSDIYPSQADHTSLELLSVEAHELIRLPPSPLAAEFELGFPSERTPISTLEVNTAAPLFTPGPSVNKVPSTNTHSAKGVSFTSEVVFIQKNISTKNHDGAEGDNSSFTSNPISNQTEIGQSELAEDEPEEAQDHGELANIESFPEPLPERWSKEKTRRRSHCGPQRSLNDMRRESMWFFDVMVNGTHQSIIVFCFVAAW